MVMPCLMAAPIFRDDKKLRDCEFTNDLHMTLAMPL